MDWAYLIQAGKEGLSERVFVSSTTEGATVGVAINGDPTAFAAAEGMLTIDNTATVASGENQWIIPISISLLCTVPGEGTFAALNLIKDNAASWTSGGTTPPAVLTSVDTRAGYSDRVAKGDIHFGNLVMPTGSARGQLGVYGIPLRNDGFLVGDTINLRFGSLGGNYASAATSAVMSVYNIDLPPVWIGRSCSIALQPLLTANASAPSFTVNVVTLELGHPRESA